MTTELLENVGSPENRSILAQNRQHAVASLTSYIQTPQELRLREHQENTLVKLKDHFAKGFTGGYIRLPCGAGKTAVAVKLAEALDLKTVYSTPLRRGVHQAKKEFSKFAPGVTVGNYMGDEKEYELRVINTTHSSLGKLAANEKVSSEEIGLVILDEGHEGLGWVRHQAYRLYPNALFVSLSATPDFSPLDELIRMGKVDSEERWTEMFRHQIDEMTDEEGFERGILSPVDIELIKTNVQAGKIGIMGGDYKRSEIRQALNKEVRNWLVIGLVAGAEHIPPDFDIPKELRDRIAQVHETLKNGQVGIFGFGIDHVDDLAAKLKNIGVDAKPVHSKIPTNERDKIFKDFDEGNLQVILGDDMLRHSWDAPSMKTAIFMYPHYSGVIANQEFGRLLRPHPEIDRKIAIQLVDEFAGGWWRSPILLPQLFDPNFAYPKMSRLRQEQTASQKKPAPFVTYSGLDVNFVMEHYETRKLLQNRFKQTSVGQMADIIDEIVDETKTDFTSEQTFELYREIADRLPARIAVEAQEVALQSMSSLDSNTRKLGKKAFLFINLKTIFSAINPYLTYDSQENTNLLFEAMTTVMEKIPAITLKYPVAPQVHKIVRETAERFTKKTGVEQRPLTTRDENTLKDIDTLENEVAMNMRQEVIEDVLASLTLRQRRVLQLRFGLENGKEHTFEETSTYFGVTRERIRQIEARALRLLRHPSRAGRLLSVSEFHIDPLENDKRNKSEQIMPMASLSPKRGRLISLMRNGYIPNWAEWLIVNPLPKNATLEDEINSYSRFHEVLAYVERCDLGLITDNTPPEGFEYIPKATLEKRLKYSESWRAWKRNNPISNYGYNWETQYMDYLKYMDYLMKLVLS